MKRLTAVILSLSLLASTSAFTSKTMAAETKQNSMTITHNGSQPSRQAPTEFFTGNVRIDPLFPANESANYSGGFVTFEPGARTVWHTHPVGQRLIITAGVGLVQEWGGPILEVRPGDVVWFPPGVKHWHGASPTTAMTHIALTGMLEGKNVEWMEKVSDQQYNSK